MVDRIILGGIVLGLSLTLVSTAFPGLQQTQLWTMCAGIC